MPFRISSPPSRFNTYCPEDGVINCDMLSENDFVFDWQANAIDDSLSYVTVEPSAIGLVSAITATPNGLITKIGTATNVVMNWSAGQSRWNPNSEFLLEDGAFYLFEVTLAITLKAGGSCSFDISQPFIYIDLGTVPTASPTITGFQQVGELLIGSDNYNSVDGIAQDVPNTVRRWYSYTNAAGSTGETLIGTGSTYTLTASEIGKWIRYKVIPAAVSGPSPGFEYSSSIFGVIVTNISSYSGFTTSAAGFSIRQTLSIAETMVIEWGDGSKEVVNGTTSILQSFPHTYSGAGTKNFKIYGNPSNIISVQLNSSNLTTALDLSRLDLLSYLFVSSNPLLTSIINPTTNTANWSASGKLYYAFSCGLTSSLDFSGFTQFPARFRVEGNTSMPNLTMKPTSYSNPSPTTEFYINNTGITALDLSTIPDMSGLLYFFSCASLTSFTGPATSSAPFNFILFYFCSNLVTLDLSFAVSGITNIHGFVCAKLETVVFPTNAVTCSSIRLYACKLTGAIDLSGMTRLGNELLFYDNQFLTSISHPTSVSTLTSYRVSNTGIVNDDISGYASATGLLDWSGCASLASITVMSPTGAISTLRVFNTGISSFSLSDYVFSSSASIDFSNNSWTATEVNQMLVNLDGIITGPVSISIEIDGTNAAPDTTAGGNNGVAAVSSLAGKGCIVTTS